MKQLVTETGVSDRFEIASAATSREEIGNDIYPPARRKLAEKGIPFSPRAARQVTASDYDYYDLIIAMDTDNVRNLRRLLGEDVAGKISLLMQETGYVRDVEDPWYTGDFEKTYQDVVAGCKALLRRLV